MLKSLLSAGAIAFGMVGPRMAQERIGISSDWGEVTADLADNEAEKFLAQMLPLAIEMSDHLRQEEDRQIYRFHFRNRHGSATSRSARSGCGVPIIS
ncbi:hypothetical protein [Mesorhizobium sp. M0684]|uniref:hypothetical protein n=1 Tax=unclassified Mesorhizobium TaxID=325217 RepID=UPI00333A0630